MDWNKLLATTRRVVVDAALRRLGYLLHLLRIRPEIARSLAKQKWHGLRFLEPTGPKKPLSYSKEFGLILNVSDAKLMSWRDT